MCAPAMVSRDASAQKPPDPLSRRLRPLALRPLGGPSHAPPPRLWSWLGTAGGCFLGGVLLVAAWAKALDPAAFAEQLHADGLDRLLPTLPSVPAVAVVLAVLALETGLGLALLLGVRRPWVLVPVTLMVAVFVGINGRAWWLAAHGQAPAGASCGCFGNLVQRTPAEAFWQDLLLLAPALALAWRGRDRNQPSVPRVRTAVVAGVTLALVLFAWRAPELPLDDLATRLKPGAAVAKVCAGDGGRDGAGAVCLDSVVPDLDRGDHLVVLDNLDDAALARAVPALNAYGERPGAAAVWLLTSADEAGRRAFFWKWGPSFKIVEAPAELLRPLYRRLPRSFAVQDGRVTATFSGLPPLAAPTVPAPPNVPAAHPTR